VDTEVVALEWVGYNSLSACASLLLSARLDNGHFDSLLTVEINSIDILRQFVL
jgi:hypothetical protein